MFEHEDAVTDAQGEGAAAAPFARDDADNRRAEPGHLAEIARDRFRLAALLGAPPEGVDGDQPLADEQLVSELKERLARGGERRAVA